MPPSLPLPLSSGHMFVEHSSIAQAEAEMLSLLSPLLKVFCQESRSKNRFLVRTAAILLQKNHYLTFPSTATMFNWILLFKFWFFYLRRCFNFSRKLPRSCFSIVMHQRKDGGGMEKGEKSQISARGDWGRGGGHSEWKMTYTLRIYCDGLDKLFF